MARLKYVGHLIGGGEVRAPEDRVKALLEYKRLERKKGFEEFFRCYWLLSEVHLWFRGGSCCSHPTYFKGGI